MLQSKEADALWLIATFIVLPLVTYFLLGKWNDASNKKARIGVLARQVEESYLANDMACADVAYPVPFHLRHDVPTFNGGMHSCNGFQPCATCQAPATTRCSRCKCVRYCSGRCQIVHWRQGHKLVCKQWNDNDFSSSDGSSAHAAPQQMPVLTFLNSPLHGSDTDETKFHGNFGGLSETPNAGITDNYEKLELNTNFPERKNSNKLRQVKFVREANASYVPHKDEIYNSNGASVSALSPKDSSVNNKNNTFGDLEKTAGGNDATVDATRNGAQHCSSKSTDTIRKGSKPCHSPGITVYEPENTFYVYSDIKLSHFDELVHDGEPPERVHALKKKPCNASLMYKAPASTVAKTVSTPLQLHSTQRAVEREGNGKKSHKKNEPRTYRNSDNCSNGYGGVTSAADVKHESLKKSADSLKHNLVQLINDNRKNKALQMLFPYDDLLKFFISEVRGICPRGLLNCGNSCYANAVLQCLTCTKPLMIYLLQRLHSNNCRLNSWCLMCELEQHALSLRESGGPISISSMLTNMREIGFRLGGGSQEDAHEFLRLLVMSMQSACLDGLGGEKVVEPRLQETTVIQQIFGGRLKSKVNCLRCHHESERYESIMDLTLEIHGWVESLQDALTQFTSPEDLDGENMYRCGRCASYVNARKQLSLYEVPNILTIVLKRFKSGSYGKINKCVSFPDNLNMIPFVTGTADNPPLYNLYGVIVHLDRENASFSGHYVSYVKDMQGMWLRIDDSEVTTVPLSQVMSEGAYMLFYSRSYPRPPRIFMENALLHAPNPMKHYRSKHQKPTKQDLEQNDGSVVHPEYSIRGIYDFTDCTDNDKRPPQSYPMYEPSAMPGKSDFSDTTSSEWSLFTSSDESSFTTESTRDSFSVTDSTENIEAVSSIFGAYYPHWHPSNSISFSRFSASTPQTKYFAESQSAHRLRKQERTCTSSASDSLPGHSHSLQMKDAFVQTSGFCEF